MLHFHAKFDHWSIAGRKEHIISFKNKEINHSAAHNKSKKRGNPTTRRKVAFVLNKAGKKYTENVIFKIYHIFDIINKSPI